MADGISGEPGAVCGSATVCSFVRRPPKNTRKRPTAPAGCDDDDDGVSSGALAALRSKKAPPSSADGISGEAGAVGGSAPVCSFMRRPPKNIRKLPTAPAGFDDDGGGGSSVLAALCSKKGPPSSAAGKLVFSTVDSSPLPRRFQHESSRTIQSTDSRATAILETETEHDRDARAIRERQLKQAEEFLKKKPSGVSASASVSASGDVYKGIHGYTDYKAGFRREHTVSSEKAGGSHGPLRAAPNICVSQRFDYQHDICKDYKKAGYCGYGDSCKFLHDRGDYKCGWQLDKEYEEAEKARKCALPWV